MICETLTADRVYNDVIMLNFDVLCVRDLKVSNLLMTDVGCVKIGN